MVPSASTIGSATSSSRSALATARASDSWNPIRRSLRRRVVMSSPMLVAPMMRPSRSRITVLFQAMSRISPPRVRIQFSS